jgi:hypothetical protein
MINTYVFDAAITSNSHSLVLNQVYLQTHYETKKKSENTREELRFSVKLDVELQAAMELVCWDF